MGIGRRLSVAGAVQRLHLRRRLRPRLGLIALVVFGQWQPWRSALGALLFALIDALQLRLQASGPVHVPYQAFLMLPFLLTIVAMALVSRNARAPAALLVPFRKEER